MGAKVLFVFLSRPKVMGSMSGRLGLHAFAMRAFDRQQIPQRETPLSGVRQRGAEVSWRMMPLSKSSLPLMPKRQFRRGLERRDGKRSKSR
jgi:hypothetical protein